MHDVSGRLNDSLQHGQIGYIIPLVADARGDCVLVPRLPERVPDLERAASR